MIKKKNIIDFASSNLSITKLELKNKNNLVIQNEENKINSNKEFIQNKKNLDLEMNSLSYSEALSTDKRTFCQYYVSLIKIKHILISAFVKNDYNSNSIKICLFFYSFALNYFTNALFFTDSTMHKIYEDGGIFNFAYSVPQIIYSMIISSVFNSLIKYLSLPANDIIKIKMEKNNKGAVNNLTKNKKCLKIKFIVFWVFCFLLLIFFWYYLSCFGAIYKHTQVYLLKDSLISFCFSLLYPFIIFLFPALIRIGLLKYPEYIYKLSKLLE